MGGKRTLGIDCRREGIARTNERHEEGIALRIDFVAAPAVEARPQQVSAPVIYIASPCVLY